MRYAVYSIQYIAYSIQYMALTTVSVLVSVSVPASVSIAQVKGVPRIGGHKNHIAWSNKRV